MKSIQLNKHQIEAVNNDATMLWVAITREMKIYARMKDYDENGLDATVELDDILTGKVEPYDETQDLIKYSCPLQIDQEYYVQEYLDFKSPYSQFPKSVKDCSIKFKVTDIQVKRIQDISHNNGEIYSIYPNAHNDGYDNFMHGFNEKFLDGKYEDNPSGFLVTIERLEK